MSEIVRALIPDHPDLYGQLGAAFEFGAVLRHANDSGLGSESDAWQLPDQLIDPELEKALDDAIFHEWHHHVGHPEDPAADDPVIDVSHAGIGHMGVYLTSVTRPQLELLATAADMLTQAENTPPKQRLPVMCEIAEFVGLCRDADQDGEDDASLAAWLSVVRVLALAIASAPATAHRPLKMFNTDGILLPVADTDGTSPAADTALVLDLIEAGDGRSVDLDSAAFHAWQRLSAEWHTAIYGASATDPANLLISYTY